MSLNDGFTFNASQFQALGDRLPISAAEAFNRELTVANRALVLSTKRSLSSLYGARLAQRWTVESSVDTKNFERLAAVNVSSADKLVRYYEYGTRAHVIRARHAHALRFQKGGQTVFARSVHHPGTPAHNKLATFRRNFENRVLSTWQPAIESALDSAFSQH